MIAAFSQLTRQDAQRAPRQPPGPRRPSWLRAVWRTPSGAYALVWLGLVTLAAAVSLFWTPHPLLATDAYNIWQGPSAEHWLGTDGSGADAASWLMAGSRTTVVVALGTTLVAAGRASTCLGCLTRA